MTTQRPKAIPTVQVDDDTFRVTEWHFPPDRKPAITSMAWIMSWSR